jgi:hypothetical protein
VLSPPGANYMRWAVVVQCERHMPTIEEWHDSLTDAKAGALHILEEALSEAWGNTAVWVMRVECRGEVNS